MADDAHQSDIIPLHMPLVGLRINNGFLFHHRRPRASRLCPPLVLLSCVFAGTVYI